MPANSTIFILGREDAAGVAALEQQCFESAWDEAMYSRFLRSERQLLGSLPVDSLPELLVVGLICDQDHRGAGGLQAYLGIRLIKNIGQGEIFNIAVKPLLRGHGLGRLLLAGTLDYLSDHGITEYFLEVRVSNTPALELYGGQNFRTVAERKNYYPDGEDAYIMHLDRTLIAG